MVAGPKENLDDGWLGEQFWRQNEWVLGDG